jgi:DNA-binding NarL/FixJ family response regulator
MKSQLRQLPTIVLVDDHLIFRQGIKSLISVENLGEVVGEASNGSEFLELLKSVKPDIVLMDINMPTMDGLEASEKAFSLYPDLKIIVFTMSGEEEFYYKTVSIGIKGFVLKSSGINELEKAIHDVMVGDNYFSNELLRRIISNYGKKSNVEKGPEKSILTEREKEVLEQVCLGLTTDEIAEKLFISPKTVKIHRSNLLEKTNSKNTPEMILFAIRNKIMRL